ncbi:hypothetical protein STXM2123_2426 [Streptomyces sp. F-3]|nr:hypothetical protein STXM2123_2426 [Streptomyces sp. F-3]
MPPRPSCHSEFDKTVLPTVPQHCRPKRHRRTGVPVCTLQRLRNRRGSRSTYGA